jgi:predicted ATPase
MKLLDHLKLTNLLSFGSKGEVVSLGTLNVLIGANGSGKSNFIEAISLLRAAPKELAVPVREGGGVRDWIWRGAGRRSPATVETVVDYRLLDKSVRYKFSFIDDLGRFELTDERIESAEAAGGGSETKVYFSYEQGKPSLNVQGEFRELRAEEIDPRRSILSQRRDPDQYPEVTFLAHGLGDIRIYREWSFGRYTPPRLPQPSDLPNNFLAEDASNLGLVLSKLRREPEVKRRLIENLARLYEGIDDFEVIVEAGTVQVFLHEGRWTVPATRLSDGTLRYLALLTILCHPKPPALVCIEEPELGLHPDILPHMASLLQDAATRMQLVVTTHSDILVDALSETPEAVLVCEKHEGATTIRRLDAQELGPWLEKYRLGELWTRGEIGGTRW